MEKNGTHKCDYCGRENDRSLIFCEGCGSELKPALPPPLPRESARALRLGLVFSVLPFTMGAWAFFSDDVLTPLSPGSPQVKIGPEGTLMSVFIFSPLAMGFLLSQVRRSLIARLALGVVVAEFVFAVAYFLPHHH